MSPYDASLSSCYTRFRRQAGRSLHDRAWHPAAPMHLLAGVIAAAGFVADPSLRDLAVVLEGGHGEVFMQTFVAEPFTATADFASLTPAAALTQLQGRAALGNGVRFLTVLDASVDAREALPRAANVRLLPPAFTCLSPRPIYGRAPDAKPMVNP